MQIVFFRFRFLEKRLQNRRIHKIKDIKRERNHQLSNEPTFTQEKSKLKSGRYLINRPSKSEYIPYRAREFNQHYNEHKTHKYSTEATVFHHQQQCNHDDNRKYYCPIGGRSDECERSRVGLVLVRLARCVTM